MNKTNKVIIGVASLNQFDITTLQMSERLPLWVKEKASILSYNRQLQFLACRFLLAELLKQYWSIERLPFIVAKENNRPVFVDPELPDFNISHSGEYIAVAVCQHGQVGLDIEQQRPRGSIEKLAGQFFSVDEFRWLHKQPDKLRAFWQLWTLRESALKLYAKGVWQMRELVINPEKLLISATFADTFYSTYQQINDIHLSLCCNQPVDTLQIIA
ncbi:MAG: 4'-phosphopantetheinyl transferase superfamily protein [Candidatus Schmidhempelia sp.]|nr:4'-phosphopantetheinyl transferase superfamily protein [Candidatus Schmidhempelia sp.]